jgi:hypothetical protein
MKMNSQTRIIVFTAVALTAVDLAVRGFLAQRTAAPVAVTCPVMQASGDVVTAREFRLVDQDGNPKAHIYTDENGEPGMVLYDRSGTNRAQLDTFQSVPSLILNSPDGGRSTYFGMDENGRSILNMYGNHGEELASMDVTGSQPVFYTNMGGGLNFSGNAISIR